MKKTLLYFTCLLLTQVTSAQFSESFEGSTNAPAGWTVIEGGDAVETWEIMNLGLGGNINAQNGTNVFSINYSTTAHNDYLVTPQFVVTTGLTDKLSFWGRSRDPLYPETISVKASTTTATAAAFTTTLLATVAPVSGTNFYKYEIDLSNFIGQSLYVGFHSTTTDNFVFDLDNIVLGSTPSCLEPTSPLSFTNITHNQINVSWASSASAPANGYEVYYGTTATAPSQTATPMVTVGAGTTNALISGLVQATKYYFYVRSKCSTSSASVWGPLASASTAFVPNYTYGFDSSTGYGLDNWTGSWSVNNTPGNAQAGTQMIFSNSSATSATNRWMFTPPISLVANQTYTFTFYLRNFGGAAPQSLKLTSAATNVAADHTNQIWSTTTFLSTTWVQQTATYTPTTSGTYYFGLNHFSPTQPAVVSLALDTFAITTTLGVDDFKTKDLKVFPNPVTDVVNISSSLKTIEEVTIIDINGRIVKSAQGNSNMMELSTSDLTSGVYFLKIQSEGNISTEKIIKQ